MAHLTEELDRWEGRHENSGEEVGGGESNRECFFFLYKKYEWHLLQKNLSGGRGGTMCYTFV